MQKLVVFCWAIRVEQNIILYDNLIPKVYNGKGDFAIRADKKSEPVIQKAKKVNMVAGKDWWEPSFKI